MRYDSDKLKKVTELVQEYSDLFRDCSYGYRAKPVLDGSFPKYHTLKYFQMPKDLREAVVDSVPNIEDNIETYFLMFKEGEGIGMTKHTNACFFINRGVLLTGSAVLTKGTRKKELTAGDTFELELFKYYAVDPKTPCIFFIEMQIDKDFNKKRKL